VDKVSERCENLRVLVRPSSVTERLVGKVELVYGDLCDLNSLLLCLDDIDVVIHCAALMSDKDHLPPEDFYQHNVIGTENVLKACLGKDIKRFIHVSTVGVYGATGLEPVAEDEGYGKDLSVYEGSKVEAEGVVLRYSSHYKLPVTIVRLGLLYGPDMSYGWPDVLRRMENGKMRIVGRGDAMLQLTYIDDAIRGMLMTLGNPRARGEVYNICGREVRSVKEIFAKMTDLLGVSRPRSVPYEMVYSAALLLRCVPRLLKPQSLSLLSTHRVRFFKDHRVYDISKAKEHLGYIPEIDVNEGMRMMVSEYLEQRDVA